jgi:hypothetical protein
MNCHIVTVTEFARYGEFYGASEIRGGVETDFLLAPRNSSLSERHLDHLQHPFYNGFACMYRIIKAINSSWFT